MDKKEYNCPDCKVPGITCKCCQRYFEMNKQVDNNKGNWYPENKQVDSINKRNWYPDWIYKPESPLTCKDHVTCECGKGTTILNESTSSSATK